MENTIMFPESKRFRSNVIELPIIKTLEQKELLMANIRTTHFILKCMIESKHPDLEKYLHKAKSDALRYAKLLESWKEDNTKTINFGQIRWEK